MNRLLSLIAARRGFVSQYLSFDTPNARHNPKIENFVSTPRTAAAPAIFNSSPSIPASATFAITDVAERVRGDTVIHGTMARGGGGGG